MNDEQKPQTDLPQEQAPAELLQQEQPAAPVSNFEPISWSASEYVSHEKTPQWYMALLGGGFVLVALVYFVTRDVLASIVVILICAAMAVIAGRKPASRRYTINDEGVQVDEKFYPYATFKCFSIVEEGPIDSIWLKPQQRIAANVVMYFPPEDEEKIADAISLFLPYEQLQLDTIDRVSKRLRF